MTPPMDDIAKIAADEVDWGAGVKLSRDLTPKSLRRSATIALERAKEWADTAERLIGKASALERAAHIGESHD